MIIETIHQDNTQIDYEKYYRNAVPWLLRFPMDISLRVLGINSYVSLLDRKAINIDKYDIGLNPVSTKDALVFALTAFPKFVALNVVNLLFKWVELNHVKYKALSSERVGDDIVNDLNEEFERTSESFTFGRLVNRKARNYIRLLHERTNIQPFDLIVNSYVQNNYTKFTTLETEDDSTESADNELEEGSNKSTYLVTKKFTVNSNFTSDNFKKLSLELSELGVLSEDDSDEFVNLFHFLETRENYTPYKRIKWDAPGHSLVFTFELMYERKILSPNDYKQMLSRLKIFFLSDKGNKYTNLSTARGRIPSKMSELRVYAANHSRPIYRSILEAIDSSFEEN